MKNIDKKNINHNFRVLQDYFSKIWILQKCTNFKNFFFLKKLKNIEFIWKYNEQKTNFTETETSFGYIPLHNKEKKQLLLLIKSNQDNTDVCVKKHKKLKKPTIEEKKS